ncbi:MAG TPA: hypothetical protein VK090_03110 [Paracoccaceae bacterium]|nr:hypothetical protein [Paracoccaceae bacterium]
MSLPKRFLFTLAEAAARWGCHVADIAEWAMSGHLEILVAIPPTHFGGKILSDLVVIAPGDIMAMFRRCGTGPREGFIHRARPLDGHKWKCILPPNAGLPVMRDDLMLRADALARFEEEHGIFRRVGASTASGYDWESFYGAMMLRIFRSGLPEKQSDLVSEMQGWFIANSVGGDAPDESTIRKRVSPIWRKLRTEG